jgi:hypothetical protein
VPRARTERFATRKRACSAKPNHLGQAATYGGGEKTSGDLSGVIPPVTEPSHAVFLSYTSEDQAAAQRICDALRSGGIEVWFDQSALRGRRLGPDNPQANQELRPVHPRHLEAHARARRGAFSLEWKLAVDRSHLMTSNKAFLLPVVIDEAREDDENVPDRFKDIHWTRLQAGEMPAAFVERVRRLVAPEPSRPTIGSPAAPVVSVAPPVTERLTQRRTNALGVPGRILDRYSRTRLTPFTAGTLRWWLRRTL